MPVKEKLSGISIESLIPAKTKLTHKIIIKDDSLRSSPFVIPKNRKRYSEFTGRIKELDYLRMLYAEMLQRTKKQNPEHETSFKPIIAAIKGEPGIGKTRLTREFILRSVKLSAGIIDNVLTGGNASTGQKQFGPFIEMIPSLKIKIKTSKNDSTHLASANLVKDGLFKKARLLNDSGLPLVVIIEDMQWADEATLFTLDNMLRSLNLYTESKQPQLMLLLNYRSTFKPTRTIRTESEYRELLLESFNEKYAIELIGKLTAGLQLSNKTAELIAKRADGNPFNIEEWCRLLTSNKKLSQIPQTVRHLLIERISALTHEERSVLIAACISGRKFDVNFVNALLRKAGKSEAAKSTLKNLEETGYIINLTGNTYEFRHDILQETIFRQLEAGLRKELHGIAGEVIEEVYKNKLSDHYYELARHYTLAKNEAKTIEYLEKAGDKAKDNYEHERALRFYNRLRPLLEGNRKFEVIFKMCDVHMNRSEWNIQIDHCNAILKTSRLLDKRIKAECYKRIGHALRLKGEYRNALSIYKKAFRIFEQDKDIQGKLDIMEHEAKVMLATGRFKDSIKSFETIYRISKEQKYIDSFKNALIGLGIANSKIGEYENTIKYNKELMLHSEDHKDKQGIINSKINEAEALFFLGKLTHSYSGYIEALRLSKRINKIQDITICMGNIGIIFFSQHKYQKSLYYFLKQLNGYSFLNDKAGISRAYGLIGSCFISIGKYKKALHYLKKQLKMSIELKRPQSEAICLGNIGIIYNLIGKFKKAKIILTKQLSIDKKIENWEGVYRALGNIGILYKNLKKYPMARKYYKRALFIAQEKKIRNIYLILFCYAEICYELKEYETSFRLSVIAENESKIHDNMNILVNSLLLKFKARIAHLLNSKGFKKGEGFVSNILKIYASAMKVLEVCSNIEERAIAYYELWKISQLLNSFKIATENLRFKKKAIKFYNLHYSKTPQIEFKYKLDELNK